MDSLVTLIGAAAATAAAGCCCSAPTTPRQPVRESPVYVVGSTPVRVSFKDPSSLSTPLEPGEDVKCRIVGEPRPELAGPVVDALGGRYHPRAVHLIQSSKFRDLQVAAWSKRDLETVTVIDIRSEYGTMIVRIGEETHVYCIAVDGRSNEISIVLDHAYSLVP